LEAGKQKKLMESDAFKGNKEAMIATCKHLYLSYNYTVLELGRY
jgi:hypothetical protein